jgi:hypothetical protein
MIPAIGPRFEATPKCKHATPKGPVVTAPKEDSNRRAKNEYEEFACHS